MPRLHVQTRLRRRTHGPHGPRPLTARERRRLETRGLDADGLDAYAEEVHDERWQQYRDRAAQASLWDSIVLEALRSFDTVAATLGAPALAFRDVITAAAAEA